MDLSTPHLLLHNCHHAIGGDGRIDLDSDSVFGVAPELFYLQMLLEPLEHLMRSFA